MALRTIRAGRVSLAITGNMFIHLTVKALLNFVVFVIVHVIVVLTIQRQSI
jgi:hypothetical protein